MNNIISKIIYTQNKELLERISNDKFSIEKEKEDFIKKYHKKGYSHINIVKKNQMEIQERKYIRVMRKK